MWRLHPDRWAAAAAGQTPLGDPGGGPGACLTASPTPQPVGGGGGGPDPGGGTGTALPSEFGAGRAARSDSTESDLGDSDLTGDRGRVVQVQNRAGI